MTRRPASIEPVIRHALPDDQWLDTLNLAQALVLAGSEVAVLVGDGSSLRLPPALLDALLDLTTLLVSRGRTTLLVVDENLECQVSEAARLLKITTQDIKRLCSEQQLEHRFVGTELRIAMSSVVERATGLPSPRLNAAKRINERRPPKAPKRTIAGENVAVVQLDVSKGMARSTRKLGLAP